jgi:hypothetical protein
MNRGPDLSFDLTDHFVAILTILFSEGRNQEVIDIIKDACTERERDTMLDAIYDILFGITLKFHARILCKLHIWSKDKLEQHCCGDLANMPSLYDPSSYKLLKKMVAEERYRHYRVTIQIPC